MLEIRQKYIILKVSWRLLANTFVEASGGMPATACFRFSTRWPGGEVAGVDRTTYKVAFYTPVAALKD